MQKVFDMYHEFKIALDFMRLWPYGMILFWIVGLLLVLFSGMCLVQLCGLEEKMELYYMAGCILAVSISHITASIAEPLGVTFHIFKQITLIVYGAAVIGMAIACKKKGKLLTAGHLKNDCMEFFNKLKKYSLLEKGLFFIIIIFCGYIMFNTMFRVYRGNTDDGYYVTKIGMMIQADSLHITVEQAANGMVHVSEFIRADASTWCTFQALIASTFGIDYTVTAHVAIVPFILLAAMTTVSLIAKAMFDEAIPRLLFWISFFLLAITTPYGSTMTNDFWIFTYSWYGVTTIYIMIYLLIYCLMVLTKREEYLCKTGFWMFAALAVTASMAMEVISVFLIPCFVLMFGFPYLIQNRNRISAGAIFRISWILIPVLHSVIAVLLTYMNMADRAMNGGENGGFDMNLSSVAAWKANQAGVWGISSVNIYTILTIVSLFLIKDKKIQRFFGWSFLTAIATFLNPLFYKFICLYVSTEIVYYRLYWCIPNLLIIAYCLVERLVGMSRDKTKLRIAFMAYMFFVLYIVGFRDSAYGRFPLQRPANIKKIPGGYVAVAETLLNFRKGDDKICAVVPKWPDRYCDYLRQYSLDIVYSLGRRSPGGDCKIPGSEFSYLEMYNRVYSPDLSEEDVEIIKSLGTQIVVFHNESEVPTVLQAYDVVVDEGGWQYVLLQ